MNSNILKAKQMKSSLYENILSKKQEVTFMIANMLIIDQIFSKNRELTIPFYQRSYVWDKEQWSRLLDDLEFITSTKVPYFIGSIILKKGETTMADSVSDRRIVIDGQQRLTTLTLFFKAYYLLTNDDDSFREDFMFKNKNKVKEISLKLGLNDSEEFNKITSLTKAEKIDDSNSKIAGAFNYFLKNIDVNKVDDLVIKQNLQFVCIEIDNSEDEQKIFDTINSLGVRLTTAELLKNYFFSKEDIESYKKYWVETFEKDDETKKYWDTLCSSGSKKRPMIDMFFDSYFQLFVENSKYEVSSEDKKVYERIDSLFSSYKSFVFNYCGNDKSVILNGLFESAKLFRSLFDPGCLDKEIPSSYGKERLNVIIFGLNNTTVIPYILYFVKESKDEASRREMFRLLESFFMKRFVVNSTGKNYNRQFMSYVRNEIVTPEQLKQELTRCNDLSTSLPTREELLDGFKNSKLTNNTTKGILYLLESALNKDGAAISIKGFNLYSLEHLMPKKWRNHWDLVTGELAENRDKVLLTLGNLAIITQKLNTSIMDSDWETKKNGKNKDFGLSIFASGLATMENVLNQDIWNEEKILERAEWLYNKSLLVWDLDRQENHSEGTKNEGENPPKIVISPKEDNPNKEVAPQSPGNVLGNKSETITYLTAMGVALQSSNKITYAKLQDKKNTFWMNPDFERLLSDWQIILNNQVTKEVILIEVPANTFVVKRDNEPNGIYPRNDKPQLDINIQSNNYVDKRSEKDFSPYIVAKYKY